MFGVGAPAARHIRVASLPSKTVTLFGGVSITGVDAAEKYNNVRFIFHKVYKPFISAMYTEN